MGDTLGLMVVAPVKSALQPRAERREHGAERKAHRAESREHGAERKAQRAESRAQRAWRRA